MIGLVPTRLASGISIKVGEYLGMGVPTIAYEAGIDGYGKTLDGVVAKAATPGDFARQTLDILEDADARKTRSEAGLKLAETELQNPDVIEALLQLNQDA